MEIIEGGNEAWVKVWILICCYLRATSTLACICHFTRTTFGQPILSNFNSFWKPIHYYVRIKAIHFLCREREKCKSKSNQQVQKKEEKEDEEKEGINSERKRRREIRTTTRAKGKWWRKNIGRRTTMLTKNKEKNNNSNNKKNAITFTPYS